MDKKIIWTLVIIIVLFLIIVGAGVGTAYYLGKKAISTPTPSSSATPCANCGKSPSPSGKLTLEQIRADHCLKSPNVGTGNITIADLAHYSEVTSPITFSGTANVFEGNFQVRIVDCSGNTTINQANVQTQSGEVGVSNPYTITITYPASFVGQFAVVEAYDLSMMDGSIQDLIQVPVYLK